MVREKVARAHLIKDAISKEMHTGKINEISTSKIRKITVIIKNRREKGMRAWLRGSNPHSKGEFFSRSFEYKLAVKKGIDTNKIGKLKRIAAVIIKFNIILNGFTFQVEIEYTFYIEDLIELGSSSVNKNK